MGSYTRSLSVLTLALLIAACGRKGGGEGETPATGDSGLPPPEVVIPQTDQAQSSPVARETVMTPLPPPTDPLLTVARNKAASIDAGISGYTMHSRPQLLGDIRSDVSVFSIGPQVVLIEEKVTTSDNSTSTNKYYFENGALFLYQDEGRWLDVNPPNPLVTKNVKRSMAFTPSGKLITASKTIDGAPGSVGEYEAVAVLTRANQLLGPLPPAGLAAATPPAASAQAGAEAASPAPSGGAEGGPAAKAKTAEQVLAENKPAEKTKPPAEVTSEKPKANEPGADNGGNRIQLQAGNTSTELKGTTPAKGTRDYVISAKAGQLLTLSLEGSPNTVFAVFSSRGEIVADLTNWSSKLPRDGDYTIKVSAADGASGSASYVLRVTLE